MFFSAKSLMSSSPQQVQASSLTIRRMRSEDVQEVMAIESVSFGRHHWSDESFYNEMNNQVGRYYVLVHQNESTKESQGTLQSKSGLSPSSVSELSSESQVIGYLGFWIILDEAHITTVAVSPQFRGNALGELLLVQSVERCMAQSVRWLTLEVRVSNYSAQNLYYKYGFASMGLRPKYYQNNQENALIMTTSDMQSAAYRSRYQQLKSSLKSRLKGFPEGLGRS